MALFKHFSTGSSGEWEKNWVAASGAARKEVLEKSQKEPNFPKKCQMHPNYDVQLWNWFLTINSDSTHQKWMKFASIVTGSIFLWVSDNMPS